jgi:oligopeptide transport system substrate-binding protein
LVATLIGANPRRHPARAVGAILAVVVLGTAALSRGIPPAHAAARTDVRIVAQATTSIDPAAQGDIASANVAAQVFESLTAFDANLVLRPAIAASWNISADGREVAFHLRPGISFSDGSPITAADVVRSWLRIIDPAAPSPLSALMLGVTGARAHLSGTETDPAKVGIRASGSDVIVDLDRPGADFPSIVSGATFAVLPPQSCAAGERTLGVCRVASGAYEVAGVTDTEITLNANDHYWAGSPAIRTVHLMSDIGGRSPVAAFEAGDVDYAPIAANDASWIRYDATLGPQLRTVPSLALTYLGFDTSRPPFDDVRVRRAIGAAVDWTKVVELGAFGGEVPADSMVPPGVPGGGDTSWLPAHDPNLARTLLAQAGYPGGAGFPDVVLGPGGNGYAEGIAADLKRELGITIRIEEFADPFQRLASDPAGMWMLGWVADYPGANDFLGVLLGSDSVDDYGRWKSGPFDQAVNDALASRDPAVAEAAFERALGLVQSDVPAVPLAYGDGWALSRAGLLGAGQNGLGILRLASLAWSDAP